MKMIKLEKILSSIEDRLKKAIAKGELKEKMILTTRHPTILGIIYSYFKKNRKDLKVALLLASMEISKRTEIVNGFYSRKDSSKYNAYYDIDILIATTPLVGIGLNITAANNFVMFNP
jgi:hypothetical protein